MIGLSEAAAPGDGDAHGPEVVGVAGAHGSADNIFLCRLRAICRPDIEREVVRGERTNGGQADRLDARRVAQLLLQRIVESRDDAGRFLSPPVHQAPWVGMNIEAGVDLLRGKAEVGVAELPERLDEQACGDEQSQRHADFADHQRVAPARMLVAGAGGGGAIAQAFLDRKASAVKTRADAEEDGREAGEKNQHRADAGIDVDVLAKGDGVGEIVAEDAQRSPCGGEPGGAADQADQQAFGKELPDQARFRRAESAADRQLAAARIGTGQHQAGEVRAGDEPYHPDGGIEGEQAGADIIGRHIAQRLHAHRFGRLIGIFVEQLGMDGRDLVLRLSYRDARPQPCDGGERGVAAIFEGVIVGQRRVDFVPVCLREFEVRRHHADDRIGIAIDGDGSADRPIGRRETPFARRSRQG